MGNVAIRDRGLRLRTTHNLWRNVKGVACDISSDHRPDIRVRYLDRPHGTWGCASCCGRVGRHRIGVGSCSSENFNIGQSLVLHANYGERLTASAVLTGSCCCGTFLLYNH